MGHKLNLSGRLRAVASFALPGLPLADIGTDHGYVPIYLAEVGIIPRAIAADVRTGPLERAAEHIREYGLEDKIEVRLSDGLANIVPGEVTQVLVAGMGGSLMARILAEGREVLHRPEFRRLILSPQSEVRLVREELARSGFQITEERMVKDDGKFYFIIIGEPGACDYSTEEDYFFGRRLVESGDEVFLEYLEEKRRKNEEILAELKKRVGIKGKVKPETGEETEPLADEKIQGRIAEIEEEQRQIYQVESRMEADMMESYHGIIQGKEKTYPKGTTLYQLAAEAQPDEPYPIVLGVRNGRICELYHRATDGNRVEFLTTKNRYGMDAYRRSVVFLMLKAFYTVCGEDRIRKIEIKHSLGGNLYCEIKENISAEGTKKDTGTFSQNCDSQQGVGRMDNPIRSEENFLNQTLIDSVLEKMRELVAQKQVIRKRYIDIEEAMELFRAHHMNDKEKLFRFRKNERVPIYELDGYRDYFYGQLVYSTECLTVFDLKLYDQGFLLCLPTVKAPEQPSPAQIPARLFATLSEADDWISKLGSGTVGELNEQIINGNFTQIMLVQEALQERKIAEIARRIADDHTKKFVLIAGPSSSGKTTFSKRLSIQLLAFGMKPHPVEVDDYFVDRERTPRDENGNYNFEALEAIDIDRFQSDLLALSAGEEIELPRFNFQKGLSEHSGRRLKLEEDDILILEGIHCMNNRLTDLIPDDQKFKIYLSALTQLNVDDHNHISTSDCRMIRRMVRDARTRGNDARATITMWPSVRRGEEENIFPYQEEADVMFNSTLVYELPILKQFAEPLLFTIRPDDVCYPEAKRLLDFLDHFLGVTSENVPTNSLLREFIGHSCFE